MAKKYYSKYKFFGVALVIFINLLAGFFTGFIFLHFDANLWLKIQQDSSIAFFILGVCFVEFMALLLLTKRCRYIVIEKEHITFINPLLPFIRRRVLWSAYDFYYIVDEFGKSGFYETIWIIKDNKLKKSISSFNYSNYSVLKSQLGIPVKKKLKINVLIQVACYFGMPVPSK